MMDKVLSAELANDEFNKLVSNYRSLSMRDWDDDENQEIKNLILQGLEFGFIQITQDGYVLTYDLEAPIMKGEEVLHSKIEIRTRISKNQFNAVKEKAKKYCKGKTESEQQEIEGMALTAFMCNMDYAVFDLVSISDISKLSQICTLFLA